MICIAAVLTGYAQTSKVEDAAIGLNNLQNEVGEAKRAIIMEAKKAIDEAAVHDQTKDDPKMWNYRAAVYDTIIKNPEFAGIDPDAVEKFAVSCKKCLETDKKRRYAEYCEYAIINSAFSAFNEAYKVGEKGNYTKALMFYQMVLDAIPYDKNEDLKKNNLSEKSITYNMMYFAMRAKDNASAKRHLQKLMDLNYDDHQLYRFMGDIYLEEGDTVKALDYIDKGRKIYPAEKELINQELNIYIVQGKQEVLLRKAEEAVTQKPEDADLIYIRGNMYDNYAGGKMRAAKALRDSSEKMQKMAGKEANAAKKARLQAEIKQMQSTAATMDKEVTEYNVKAEADYNKALEYNPDMIDVYYNLAVLTNNKAVLITDKMNAIEAKTQAEYDKKFGAFKVKRDSILNVAIGYFNKGLEIVEVKGEDTDDKKRIKYGYMKDIYAGITMIYGSMGNEQKFNEYRKKKDEMKSKLAKIGG